MLCFVVGSWKWKAPARVEWVAELLISNIVSAQNEAAVLFVQMEDKRLKNVLDMEWERREHEHAFRAEEREHEERLMRIVMDLQQGMLHLQQFMQMQPMQ